MERRSLRTDAVDRSRRRYLLAAGTAGASAIAGCLGAEELPEPIALEEDHSCQVCNMVVVNHPGPSGHAVYDADADVPGAEDGVVPFCSSACAYEFYFAQLEAGHEPVVLYLTDYSRVDWEVYDQQGIQFITAHFEAEAQAPASDLEFVVDSDVLGAMGESLIGFGDPDDAASFADRYGGEVFDHDSISRALVEGLGA